MPEFLEVHTTIDSKEGAQRIAEAIVSQRLAAFEVKVNAGAFYVYAPPDM